MERIVESKVCVVNVIKSKIMRTDFFIKLIVCVCLLVIILNNGIEMINYDYSVSGTERCNLLMYLLMVFTSDFFAYYYILVAFAILVADIVYEEYLTKNIFVMYGSRKKVYLGMLKLVASFSIFFISLLLLLSVLIGVSRGLDLSFDFTDSAIRLWAKEQDFYILRSTSVYIPVSVLKYNSFLVLAMVIFKYYIGLMLLAMIGLVFSIKKDSVQYGTLAILLTLLLNIAVLEYYGPWTFYNLGISIDLSGIFNYITVQRFFIYDWAGIKKDVVVLFRDTMFTGAVWFAVLSMIIYYILKKKDI